MPDYTSIDWGNADLYDGLTQRPTTAIPLQIPMKNLQPKPTGSTPAYSAGELAVIREEQAAMQEYFRQEQSAKQAREQEIFNREQTQRDLLRNRTNPAEPPPTEPRITNRNPEWEQPTPTSKSPTQPPAPTSAKPPVTPNTSGARLSPNFDPTAAPAPAALKELIPPGSSPSISRPSSLPVPAGAGRLALPVAGAALDFGMRLIHGQTPQQAGFGAGGALAGGLIGAGIGSVFGPAGTFVGGLIGGYVGGAIGDYIYRLSRPPSATVPDGGYHAPHPQGQESCAVYSVTCKAIYADGQIGDPETKSFYGPINGTKVDSVGTFFQPTWHGKLISGGNIGVYGCNPKGDSEWIVAISFFKEMTGLTITNIQRVDGELDYNPNSPAPSPPPDLRTPASYFHPGNQEYAPPRGTLAAGQNPAPNNYASGGTTAGSSPRGDSPDWVPHGALAPRQNPNPTTTPSNLGGDLPSANPRPATPATPADQAVAPPQATPSNNPSNTPSSTPTSFTYYGPSYTPTPSPGDNNAKPIPIGGGQTATIPVPPTNLPSGLPPSGKSTPTPDANSPTPKNQDPTTPSINPLPFGFPALIPPTPPTNLDGNGCNSCQAKILSSSQGNSNKLDLLNAGLNGLDLAGIAGLNAKLDLINNKLGEQLPDGIGGKLTRLSKWLHLDRVLNMMIWATTIHNAVMLSNDIGQTLLSAIGNVFQLFGLKDSEGNAFNLGEIISSSIENLIKGIIGADNYTELKEVWAKANRIYQATVNILNNFQNLASTILTALEMTAGKVAKIGNALRSSGEVLDNAYNWMNPQPKYNRITQTLESLQNGASTIQMVTQAPLDVIQATTELTNSATELTNAIKDDTQDSNKGKEAPEPDKLKADKDASKTASAGKEITSADLDPDD